MLCPKIWALTDNATPATLCEWSTKKAEKLMFVIKW
ncbi:hypothetical protein EDC91_11936 [Shewanella fodinae]|uniref:Uncharacterized protein n=1 Tax=Shewanella fodinae TaxID=552357 RepID=A0A4R2F6J6_9GAMM|nr:hypothetical protein EDC91_11936 [Shewanella fodinae]